METLEESTKEVDKEAENEKSESMVAADGTVEIRSFNVCIGVVGAPGSGKSTYALARAMQYGRRGAYIMAHDLGFKLPDKLPGGKDTGIVRYDDVDQCKEAMESDASGIHCMSTMDADEVIVEAQRVAKSSLEAHGGTRGNPVVVLIDEVVSLSNSDPYRLDGELKRALALRRHDNVGYIWTCQSPNLCHYQMIGIGTELVVFRLYHKKDLDQLERVGFTPHEIDTVKALPDHAYIVKEFR
jgi:hypothetical protein